MTESCHWLYIQTSHGPYVQVMKMFVFAARCVQRFTHKHDMKTKMVLGAQR